MTPPLVVILLFIIIIIFFIYNQRPGVAYYPVSYVHTRLHVCRVIRRFSVITLVYFRRIDCVRACTGETGWSSNQREIQAVSTFELNPLPDWNKENPSHRILCSSRVFPIFFVFPVFSAQNEKHTR